MTLNQTTLSADTIKTFRKSQRPSTHLVRVIIEWGLVLPSSIIFVICWPLTVFLLLTGQTSSATSAGLISLGSIAYLLGMLGFRAHLIPTRPKNALIIFPTAAAWVVFILSAVSIIISLILQIFGFHGGRVNILEDAFPPVVVFFTQMLPIGSILAGLMLPPHRRLVDYWNPRKLPIIKSNTSKHPRRAAKKGMTLIELLIVIAILAILAAAVSNVVSAYATTAKKEKYSRNALITAQNQIDYFRATGTLPTEGQHPLTPEIIANNPVHFPDATVTITPTENPELYIVRVNIPSTNIPGQNVMNDPLEIATILQKSKDQKGAD